MAKTNIIIDIFDEARPNLFSSFENVKRIISAAINSNRATVEEFYKYYAKINSERTVTVNEESLVAFRDFLLSNQRIAAYDATQWKKLRAVVDFIDSGSTEMPTSIFTEVITFIAQSKFVDVHSVLTVALPVNDIFEPLANEDSRYHQLVRVIGDVLSKKSMEIEQEMTFSETDWNNSILLAQAAFKFPIEAVESL